METNQTHQTAQWCQYHNAEVLPGARCELCALEAKKKMAFYEAAASDKISLRFDCAIPGGDYSSPNFGVGIAARPEVREAQANLNAQERIFMSASNEHFRFISSPLLRRQRIRLAWLNLSYRIRDAWDVLIGRKDVE